MNNLDNFIYHKHDIIEVSNLFSKKECESIVQYFESYSDRWKVFNDSFTKCYGMHISLYDRSLEKFGLKKDIFQELNYTFKKIVESSFDKSFDGVTFHVQKWETGGMVEEHSDTSDLYGNLNENSSNKYTVILYLNDDYEGGELYFPQHDIRIKPKVGSAVTFPGDHTNIHGVSEVTNGLRYTIVSWWDFKNDEIDEKELEIWDNL